VIPLTIKPRNIDFIQRNALDGLLFEDNTFDFVYQRLLIAAYPANKWQEVINELVRVVKPGGYLEVFSLEILALIPEQNSI
jgi:ubiquinone/menaquinone biosynthesis C-methylase UbiE